MSDSGLFLNTEHPYLGASPDGLVTHECCGAGGCETKCPLCHKDDDISVAAKEKTLCLEETAGGYCLKRNHHYYYQARRSLVIIPLETNKASPK